MQTTLRTRSTSRTITTSLVAVVLALASTAAMARAMSYDGDDDEGGKSEACGYIGCKNGARECGKASGKISAGMPPFVGEVQVSWTCYEAGVA